MYYDAEEVLPGCISLFPGRSTEAMLGPSVEGIGCRGPAVKMLEELQKHPKTRRGAA